MLSLLAKRGTIELSDVDSDELDAILDSDSSTLDELLDDNEKVKLTEPTTCSTSSSPAPEDTTSFVRRSTRPRRSSVRANEIINPKDPIGLKNAASKKTIKTLPKRRKNSTAITKQPSTTVTDEPSTRQCLDPDVLLAYTMRFGTKNPIPPNKFGVRVAVGPDEHVIVEAVEYLHSLGYPNIEMDESIPKNWEEIVVQCQNLDRCIRTMVKDGKAVETTKLPPTTKSEEIERYEISNSTTDLESSGDGSNLSFPPRDPLSKPDCHLPDSSSDSEVDIEVTDNRGKKAVRDFLVGQIYSTNARENPQNTKRTSQTEKALMKIINGRAFHNMAERERRVLLKSELTALFDAVADQLQPNEIQPFRGKLPAKIAILKSALDVVLKLQNEFKRLVDVIDQLKLKRARLTKRLDHLKDRISSRMQGGKIQKTPGQKLLKLETKCEPK